MEVKKTERASLEKNKNIYTLLGLAISLAIMWFAFEYKTYDKIKNELLQMAVLEDEEDIVLNTTRNEPPPPPPPPAPTTVIEIVEDNIEVDDIEIDIETDNEEEIEEAIIVEEDEGEEEEKEIFVFVEEQPSFPGGEAARINFINTNVVYPQRAIDNNIQGIVYVTFVVEPNGSLSGIKVVRGIGGGCDEEAMEVVKKMPKWNAGKQRGKAVRVQFNMPIKFVLR